VFSISHLLVGFSAASLLVFVPRCALVLRTRRRVVTRPNNPADAQPAIPAETAEPAEGLQSMQREAFRAAVNAIPAFLFEAPDEGDPAKSTDQPAECAVCLGEFQALERVKQLPCLHIFHETCIDRWLLESMPTRSATFNSCPLCKRAPLEAGVPATEEPRAADAQAATVIEPLSVGIGMQSLPPQQASIPTQGGLRTALAARWRQRTLHGGLQRHDRHARGRGAQAAVGSIRV